MLTLFAVPKPFSGNVETIQRNALGSWAQLGEAVEVLLIGDEPGVEQAAAEFGFRHIPVIERTRAGTPRVDSAFELARGHSNYEALCYLNADIILLEGLLEQLVVVQERFSDYLIVGQRWDLAVAHRLDFGPGWREDLWSAVRAAGRMHPPAGSDYFVYPKHLIAQMPPFALGRSGWDNWMIYAGRKLRVPVVDATGAVSVVHQDHDYSHLEGGVPHYRLPESRRNVRVAGGRHTVFTLRDATWRIDHGELVRVRLPGGDLGRAVESALITSIDSGRGQQLLRTILHPLEFLRSRGWRRPRQAERADDVRGGWQ